MVDAVARSGGARRLTTGIVVVGGGVAGGALATVLARAGREVLVLERSTRYRDQVLGEYIIPWGVREVQRLGLLDTLVGAGANVLTRLVHYDEGWPPERAEREALRFDELLPGVPGALGIRHPALCAALTASAEAAGATVLRGVREVEVTLGPRPSVRFVAGGHAVEASCELVVGADGRDSGVRRRLGFEWVQTPVLGYGTGLLVQGAKGWPEEVEALVNEDDKLLFVFPQGSGVVRLYRLVLPHERERFSGRERSARFLEEFRLRSAPHADELWTAEPAGPCVTWPMHDAWTRHPVAEGVVLVGDAAGYSNPLIGQGLSIALRDARLVAEAVLDGASGPEGFAAYTEERKTRMRRLRFCLEMFARWRCVMGPGSAERRVALHDRLMTDPAINGWFWAGYTGVERYPEEAFGDDIRQALWGP